MPWLAARSPLAAGLRCANEIAAELRDLHQQNRAYGNLSVNHVILSRNPARACRRCETLGTRRRSSAMCRHSARCSTRF